MGCEGVVGAVIECGVGGSGALLRPSGKRGLLGSLPSCSSFEFVIPIFKVCASRLGR